MLPVVLATALTSIAKILSATCSHTLGIRRVWTLFSFRVPLEAAEYALHRNTLVVDRLPFGRLVRKRAEPLAVVVPEGPVFGGLVFTLVAVIVDVGIYASQGS